VPSAGRAAVHELGKGFFQVLLQYRFTETPDVLMALADITTAEFGFDPEMPFRSSGTRR